MIKPIHCIVFSRTFLFAVQLRSDYSLVSRRLHLAEISPMEVVLIMSYVPQGHRGHSVPLKKAPYYKSSVISALGISRGRVVIRVINYPSREHWISRKNDSDRSFNLQPAFRRLWQTPHIPYNAFFHACDLIEFLKFSLIRFPNKSCGIFVNIIKDYKIIRALFE